ncbi:MAG TPA: patatin-like phospholipase family protein [Xanthobacteraceae bacterium]|nr:patatin-like phospholipase family protein [Xanthobacteraceae bacterium]
MTEPESNPPLERHEPKAGIPKIGLALSGGAARGWAHIGVVKTLVKNGITPDVIAGTSIGALVGGVWAAGKLDELEAWVRSINKRRILGLMDFRFGGAGLIAGGRLADLLVKNLGDTSIESLPVRFAAIATELGTGHEIWLTQGSLSQAMRASYALPGIFNPVKVAGRWLMDGALVNPVPVTAARALGARVVVAVNLNADLFGRGTVIQNHGLEEEPSEVEVEITQETRFGSMFRVDRLIRRQFFGDAKHDGPSGISSVMIDAFNITQDRISRSRLAGDPPDVLISPKLSGIGLFDFANAANAIQLGEEAAERALQEIREATAALL